MKLPRSPAADDREPLTGRPNSLSLQSSKRRMTVMRIHLKKMLIYRRDTSTLTTAIVFRENLGTRCAT
jgi:hypothetical protein